MKRILVILVTLLVVGFVGVRVADVVTESRQPATRASRPGGFGAAPPPSVTVEPATLGTVEEVTLLSGTVEPRYQVEALPRRGGRLAAVYTEVGARVQRGERLGTVEHAELLLQEQQTAAGLTVSRASLLRAESQLERVRADYERVERLRELGAATEQELKNALNQLREAEIQLDVSRAQLEQAEANYEMMRLQLGHVHIEAPVDGVVMHRPFVVGGQVSTSTPFATIAGLDPIDVVFHFSERRLGELRMGQPFVVTADAFPAETFAGEVTEIGAEIDSQTRTVAVRGQVPNPDLRLRPGMFARVELVIGRAEDVVTVPREALMMDSEGYFLVVVEGDRAVHRPVRLGVQGRERLEVADGVDVGDIVITVGQQRLRDGQIVRPVGVDGEPLAVEGGAGR